MKRSVTTSRTHSEELVFNQCESKKRKINSPNANNSNLLPKVQTDAYQSSFLSHPRDGSKISADSSNAKLPVGSNGINVESPSWNPHWGQKHSWTNSRTNLNYCSFETKNDSSIPSCSKISSDHHPLMPSPLRCGVTPISFFTLESKFVPKLPPDTDFRGTKNRLEKISKDLWNHFTKYQQSGKIFHQKVELWNELERVLKRRFRCATHVFGSTLNGFGSNESDMDLCMFNGQVKSKRGKDDVRLLAEVRRAIRYCEH